MTLDDVVEVGILLTTPVDFDGMNEVYARWFPADPPTRYAAAFGAEIPGLLVSIPMMRYLVHVHGAPATADALSGHPKCSERRY